MNDNLDSASDQAAAFLKMWTESCSKLAQAAWSVSPESVPSEIVRQVRASLFQSLAQSWDEFLRSPRFLEGMKQMMDNAIAFRKVSTEMLTQARHNSAGTAGEDVEALLLAIRRSEDKLSARLDELTQRVQELAARLENKPAPATTARARKDVEPGQAKPAPVKRFTPSKGRS